MVFLECSYLLCEDGIQGSGGRGQDSGVRIQGSGSREGISPVYPFSSSRGATRRGDPGP